MPRFPFRRLLVLPVVLLGFCSGCTYFPEFLQPHELQKLNRGSGPSSDPFTSIDANRSARIIPTSYDRPALVNDRPSFTGVYKID